MRYSIIFTVSLAGSLTTEVAAAPTFLDRHGHSPFHGGRVQATTVDFRKQAGQKYGAHEPAGAVSLKVDHSPMRAIQNHRYRYKHDTPVLSKRDDHSDIPIDAYVGRLPTLGPVIENGRVVQEHKREASLSDSAESTPKLADSYIRQAVVALEKHISDLYTLQSNNPNDVAAKEQTHHNQERDMSTTASPDAKLSTLIKDLNFRIHRILRDEMVLSPEVIAKLEHRLATEESKLVSSFPSSFQHGKRDIEAQDLSVSEVIANLKDKIEDLLAKAKVNDIIAKVSDIIASAKSGGMLSKIPDLIAHIKDMFASDKVEEIKSQVESVLQNHKLTEIKSWLEQQKEKVESRNSDLVEHLQDTVSNLKDSITGLVSSANSKRSPSDLAILNSTPNAPGHLKQVLDSLKTTFKDKKGDKVKGSQLPVKPLDDIITSLTKKLSSISTSDTPTSQVAQKYRSGIEHITGVVKTFEAKVKEAEGKKIKGNEMTDFEKKAEKTMKDISKKTKESLAVNAPDIDKKLDAQVEKLLGVHVDDAMKVTAGIADKVKKEGTA